MKIAFWSNLQLFYRTPDLDDNVSILVSTNEQVLLHTITFNQFSHETSISLENRPSVIYYDDKLKYLWLGTPYDANVPKKLWENPYGKEVKNELNIVEK